MTATSVPRHRRIPASSHSPLSHMAATDSGPPGGRPRERYP